MFALFVTLWGWMGIKGASGGIYRAVAGTLGSEMPSPDIPTSLLEQTFSFPNPCSSSVRIDPNL